MHNLKHLALAFLLATLAITPAFAKPGRCGKAFDIGEQQATRLEHLKESLDLTAQQEKEIKEILAASKEGNETLREERRSTRKELREMSRADTLDEPRLRELVHKQSDQRADMMIAKHATRARINQVLSPEQQEQHEAVRQQRQERRGSAKHRQGKQ
ncbi:MAG: periplasmic heavy metal sensor [Deltaproteobacteria bacterium]|nr:MAG: periplasmic heavy metal sensor [Deltaproteobacteria bacterium]